LAFEILIIIERLFKFSENETSARTEMLAGVTNNSCPLSIAPAASLGPSGATRRF
jgi:hypothetical protein